MVRLPLGFCNGLAFESSALNRAIRFTERKCHRPVRRSKKKNKEGAVLGWADACHLTPRGMTGLKPLFPSFF
jgi:hypothetical protein